MPRASKRELVLDTAEKLFTQNGFNATGINLITHDADIASMTLYNNFKNKEELVLAVLARAHQQMMEELEAALDAVGDDPSACILAIFDYMATYAQREVFQDPGAGSFTGCIFHYAAAEFRPLSHPIHQAAAEHHQQLLDIFEEEAEALGHPNPQVLAQTLLVLLDGTFASAQIMGDLSLFEKARTAAETLIDLSP